MVHVKKHNGDRMQRVPLYLAVLVMAALMLGCRQNPLESLDFMGPQYVGDYMRDDDVRRIAHALDTAAARTPVKWENADTGYQYSLMIFSADEAVGVRSRTATVLAIEPSGDAEILDLVCTSDTPHTWLITATGPASFVGRAARMDLPPSATPPGTLASEDGFKGFVVSR
jgi:hypothetical protein